MAQFVFSDPILVSNTANVGNTGDGTLSVTKLTHFTIDQTYTITCIQTTPKVAFSVIGDVDGSVGVASEGETFIDRDLKIEFIITAGPTAFVIGDKFTVEVAQGTDINQDNLDTYDEWPQKNFSDDNDDNLRYDDTGKCYSFNADEVTDPGNFFEGNALVRARDFLTHSTDCEADTYPYDATTSQKETGDETLFRKLLKITPNSPEDTAVNVAAASITRADGTQLRIYDSLGNVVDFTGGTIDFSTGVVTNGASFTPATLGAGEYVMYGIALSTEDPAQLNVFQGSSDPVLANLEEPAMPSSYTRIGFVTVQDNGAGGSGTINVIDPTNILQMVASTAGAEQDSLIQDILTVKYAARIDDNLTDDDVFDELATSATFTGGEFSIAYDNKTVTVLGNNVTIAGACSFTVAVGDVIMKGSSIATIVNINSQTDFDVDDASGLITGQNATFSQVATTTNLPLYGDAVEMTRTRDFIATDIDQVLLWYEDNIYQDAGNTPSIAASVSSNQINFTDKYVRPEDFMSEHTAILIDELEQSNDLIIRFFANITSGSGNAILDSWRVYFHQRSQSGALVGTEKVTETQITVSGVDAINNSGALIPKYSAVRTDGLGLGGVLLADNGSVATAIVVGIAEDDTSNGASMTIITDGSVGNANSELGFNDGDEVYLSTAGTLTNIAPSTPGDVIVYIGQIFGNDLIVDIAQRGVV